ncbi:unnamed protein product, partial [Meganyctiphanes norvegica]
MTSIRMLLQLAVAESLKVHQLDFDSAYLNAEIDCEIYMEPPELFPCNKPSEVLKIKKSLYGLKQSGRLWNEMLHAYLVEKNFTRSLVDTCVYTQFNGKSKMIILVWVDDLILAASDENELKMVKMEMQSHFKMKDLGVLKFFLGIEIQVEGNVIKMMQSKYIGRVLKRFRMTDCKPKDIPCTLGVNKELGLDSQLLDESRHRLYREMVGSIIYVMTGTRPDICYAVTLLSQHLANPTETHLKLCKDVIRYLKKTQFHALRFVKPKELSLTGFCDADWGGSKDRKSISGYCFTLNPKGALISWRSSKQRSVATSSCEAEYIALTEAVKESKFLRQLLSDMTGCGTESVLLYDDNQSAIKLAKNPVFHDRSKH